MQNGLRKKTPRNNYFRLKLSSAPIDLSRMGKISAEEREILLARQKLLDADDQMASFLTMQHQVKLLQDELGDIKLKLAQLSAPPPSPATSLDLWANVKSRPAIFLALLVLATLALLLGLRFFNRANMQIGRAHV